MFYNPLLCLLSVVVSKYIRNTWNYINYCTNLFNTLIPDYILFSYTVISRKLFNHSVNQCYEWYIFWHWLVQTWTLRFQTLNLAKHRLHGERFTGGRCDLYVQFKNTWINKATMLIIFALIEINVQPKIENIPKTCSRCF